MKKKNLNGKKLALNKVTVGVLNNLNMNAVYGGVNQDKSKDKNCGVTMSAGCPPSTTELTKYTAC